MNWKKRKKAGAPWNKEVLEIYVYKEGSGVWLAKYGWGQSKCNDVYKAIYLAIRQMVSTAPPAIEHRGRGYGEWFSSYQESKNKDVEIHRERLLREN